MKATSLIVVGTPFSGAVLLGHALGAHPQAFFAGELWRQWDREADPGARECPTCGGDCATWSAPAVASAVADGPAATSAALARATGRRVVIEGPAPASWIGPRLADGESFGEDARIVVCVCDPLHYVRRRGAVTEDAAKRCANEWRDEQFALARAALSSGRPLLVLRYEDLINRIEETLARACSFAGLAHDLPLRDGWEAPTHAIGATSEAWGVAEPVRTSLIQVAAEGATDRRVGTLHALDGDSGASLGADLAREVIAGLRPTGLYETFGIEPALPPYRAPGNDAEHRRMVAWVKEDLRRAREAVLGDQANAAIATLRMLVDHFGPAFDDLGLELKYENLAIVLVDLLNNQQRGAEALPYARALLGHAPQSVEARRLLSVASASTGCLGGSVVSGDHGREVDDDLPAPEVPPGRNVMEVFRVADRGAFSRLWEKRFNGLIEAQSALSPGGTESFTLSGVCAVCGGVSVFVTDFLFASPDATGRVLPAWRERQICSCRLNCRQRSCFQLLTDSLGLASSSRLYCTEQQTDLYQHIRRVFPGVVGSEFHGDRFPLGSLNHDGVRNEDVTRLTFPDESFDCVLSLDVMEHVPDYRAGFREMARCLRPGGTLLLTVPFHFGRDSTAIRASANPDGSLTHHLPPVHHGDPICARGALCFNDFGWDMMDDLRAAGFGDATVFVFTAPQLGYIGLQYVFLMTRCRAEAGARNQYRWPQGVAPIPSRRTARLMLEVQAAFS